MQISKPRIAWLTVVNFAFFIFFLSAVPDLKSGLDTTLDIILRKIAHATEFGILAFLIFLAFGADKLSIKRNFLGALFLASLYALSDEIHQNFVPGREMALLDFLIDFCGIILVLSSFYFKREKM